MKAEDPFERRLRETSPRRIPESWHKEILGPLSPARTPASPQAAGIGEFLRTLLWPHPRAWTALGAAWLAIVVLNHASLDPAGPQFVRASSPKAPQMRELLKEQERLLAELSGVADSSEPRRKETSSPQPRSCRELETYNT